MSSFEEELDLIFAKMKEILLYKNKKYGSSFDNQADRYGHAGIMIPIRNKVDRLDQLYTESDIDTLETIEDSHFDAIGYHTLALRRKLFNQNTNISQEKKAPYSDLDD